MRVSDPPPIDPGLPGGDILPGGHPSRPVPPLARWLVLLALATPAWAADLPAPAPAPAPAVELRAVDAAGAVAPVPGRLELVWRARTAAGRPYAVTLAVDLPGPAEPGAPVVPAGPDLPTGPTAPPDGGAVTPDQDYAGAARQYLRGLPAMLRQVAADRRAGKITTMDQLILAIEAGRQHAADGLARRMAQRWAGAVAEDGSIAGGDVIDKSLLDAAAAMEAGLK